MKSVAIASFGKSYYALPPAVRGEAKKAFRLFGNNPAMPGLSFERLRCHQIRGPCELRRTIGWWGEEKKRQNGLVLDRQSRRVQQEVSCVMSPNPEPPFDPQPQGISLNELAEAFAQVMGPQPRRAAEPPGCRETRATRRPWRQRAPAVSRRWNAPPNRRRTSRPLRMIPAPSVRGPFSRRCSLSAIATTGRFRPGTVAELLRDVEADEIPSLVDELNRRYAAGGAPYRIVGEEDGYRLTLGPEFHPLAQPLLRPHPRGPLIAGRHRRAGPGGLSAADHRRGGRPPAGQAEQPHPDPSGPSRPLADRAAGPQAADAALLHHRPLPEAVQSRFARRPAAERGRRPAVMQSPLSRFREGP